MSKTYHSTTQMGPYPPYVVFAILAPFPLLGFVLAFCAFYVAHIPIAPGELGDAVCLFLIMMLLAWLSCWYGWVGISSGLAKYRFEDNCLVAKYPLRSEKRIPWTNFQQVCICYAAYTTRGERKANTVICCIQKGERKNWRGRWKTDNLFRYKTVIAIDYKPHLVEELQAVCPYEVADLRNTREYRLS